MAGRERPRLRPKSRRRANCRHQLKLQDEVAQKLKTQRFQNGALNLQTDEVHPLVLNDQVVDVVKQQKNRATELIEDFMVAANGVVARHARKGFVPAPHRAHAERWDRIVQLAATKGEKLPAQPDSKALNDFLLRRKAADPDHFADVSLAVIKLIGPGEYVLERAGEPPPGHFGLAVQDYTHSTAPNRRFADVVTQRLIKAMLAGQPNPYSDAELTAVAANCTQKEDAAKKVEREMSKRLAAVAMQHRIGEVFDAIVTGATDHGTFVRVLQPHIEGMLAQGRKARCRRQAASQAHPHRCAEGIHRFRPRLGAKRTPVWSPRQPIAASEPHAKLVAVSSVRTIVGRTCVQWRNFVCVPMMVILPASLMADDTGAAMLRSKAAFSQQESAPASTALFPDDLIETQQGAAARIEAPVHG